MVEAVCITLWPYTERTTETEIDKCWLVSPSYIEIPDLVFPVYCTLLYFHKPSAKWVYAKGEFPLLSLYLMRYEIEIVPNSMHPDTFKIVRCTPTSQAPFTHTSMLHILHRIEHQCQSELNSLLLGLEEKEEQLEQQLATKPWLKKTQKVSVKRKRRSDVVDELRTEFITSVTIPESSEDYTDEDKALEHVDKTRIGAFAVLNQVLGVSKEGSYAYFLRMCRRVWVDVFFIEVFYDLLMWYPWHILRECTLQMWVNILNVATSNPVSLMLLPDYTQKDKECDNFALERVECDVFTSFGVMLRLQHILGRTKDDTEKILEKLFPDIQTVYCVWFCELFLKSQNTRGRMHIEYYPDEIVKPLLPSYLSNDDINANFRYYISLRWPKATVEGEDVLPVQKTMTYLMKETSIFTTISPGRVVTSYGYANACYILHGFATLQQALSLRPASDLVFKDAEGSAAQTNPYGLDMTEEECKTNFHELQFQGIKSIEMSGITVIYGGAGVGKSRVLRLIRSRTLKSVLILAPTASVQSNLQEGLNPNAVTYDYFVTSAKHGVNKDVFDAIEVLIFEEGSMISEKMMGKMVTTMVSGKLPKLRRVVFVCDSQQFSSIEPGTIGEFLEALPAGLGTCVELQKNYRILATDTDSIEETKYLQAIEKIRKGESISEYLRKADLSVWDSKSCMFTHGFSVVAYETLQSMHELLETIYRSPFLPPGAIQGVCYTNEMRKKANLMIMRLLGWTDEKTKEVPRGQLVPGMPVTLRNRRLRTRCQISQKLVEIPKNSRHIVLRVYVRHRGSRRWDITSSTKDRTHGIMYKLDIMECNAYYQHVCAVTKRGQKQPEKKGLSEEELLQRLPRFNKQLSTSDIQKIVASSMQAVTGTRSLSTATGDEIPPFYPTIHYPNGHPKLMSIICNLAMLDILQPAFFMTAHAMEGLENEQSLVIAEHMVDRAFTYVAASRGRRRALMVLFGQYCNQDISKMDTRMTKILKKTMQRLPGILKLILQPSSQPTHDVCPPPPLEPPPLEQPPDLMRDPRLLQVQPVSAAVVPDPPPHLQVQPEATTSSLTSVER